jgi:hypothetical protein
MQRTLFILLTSLLLFPAGCGESTAGGGDLETSFEALTGEFRTDCHQRCVEEDVDPEDCDRVCDALEENACHRDCVEAGGDEETCRLECYPEAACYLDCIDEGGTLEACRLACHAGEDEEPCTDGDESIREGILYICVDGDWQEAS